MDALNRKSFAGAFKAIDVDQGVVEMLVAVFDNVDRSDERIRPGAFKESLARKLPKGVWMHDWASPVAKTLDARELLAGDPALPERLRSNGGLYIKAQFNLETQRGKDAFSDLKFGAVDEFSIGFQVKKWSYDQESMITDLDEIELFEWSPVLVGCNPSTAILSVKEGLPDNLAFADSCEHALAAVQGITARAKAIRQMRGKEGRTLSAASRQRMLNLHETLEEASGTLDACMADLSAFFDETDASKAAAATLADLRRYALAQQSGGDPT